MAQKKCVTKRNVNFKIIKTFLDATQLENKINYIEKIKIEMDSIKENHK